MSVENFGKEETVYFLSNPSGRVSDEETKWFGIGIPDHRESMDYFKDRFCDWELSN